MTLWRERSKRWRDESWFGDGGAAGGWTQTGKEVMDDSRVNPPSFPLPFSVYSLNLYRTGSKAEPKDNVTFLSSICFYLELLL